MSADGNVTIKINLKDENSTQQVSKINSNFKKLGSTMSKVWAGTGKEITSTEKKLGVLGEAISKQELNLQKLTDKKEKMLSGETKPTGFKSLNAELTRTEKQLDKLAIKSEKLKAEESNINASSFTVDGMTGYAGGEQSKARLGEIQTELSSITTESDIAKNKITELQGKISSLTANPAESAEMQNLNTQIDVGEKKLNRLREEEKALETQANKTNSALGSMGIAVQKGCAKAIAPLQSIGKRILGLVKRVMLFSVIAMGLRQLRTAFTNIISSDDKMSASLQKIKGNLLTAFAPIYSYIIPALRKFFAWLEKVTQYLVYFMSILTGKSVKSMQDSAKGMYDDATATQETADATADATKNTNALTKATTKATKTMAGFDTVQTLSNDADNDTSVSTTVPTASTTTSSSSSAPEFALGNIDTTKVDDLQKKLQRILTIAKAIGIALIAWKISGALGAGLKGFLGIFIAIVGLIKFIKGFMDAWKNGIDFSNMKEMLLGVMGIVAGLTLAFGAIGGAVGAIVAGIALVVLGIKDGIDNGWNLYNVLLIISGVALIIGGIVALVTGSWIPLLIATLVAGVALFIAWLVKNKEKVKKWFESLGGKISNFVTKTKKTIGDFFKSIWNGFLHYGAKAINFIIGLFESAINLVPSAIETIFNGIAKGLVTLLNKIPGNDQISFTPASIPRAKLGRLDVPKLANGAVLPANNPFLAMVGDQKNGTNIEAPLDTITQAMISALKAIGLGGSQELVVSGNMAQFLSFLNVELKKNNARMGRA